LYEPQPPRLFNPSSALDHDIYNTSVPSNARQI